MPLLRPLVTVLVCAGLAFPQTGSLPSRETLLYNIEWRLFSAGKAKLDFAALPASRPEYQVDLHLESSGFVSKLFKVEDDYSASLNAGLCVQSSRTTAHEGNRQREKACRVVDRMSEIGCQRPDG